jgi:hypothetical protein
MDLFRKLISRKPTLINNIDGGATARGPEGMGRAVPQLVCRSKDARAPLEQQ